MARILWQPAHRPTGVRLPSLPWRSMLVPCLVTLVGGIVFYALIVQLSFVLTDVGVTSTAAIGGISALMSIATASGSVLFARMSHHTPRSLVPVAFAISAVGLATVVATRSLVPRHR